MHVPLPTLFCGIPAVPVCRVLNTDYSDQKGGLMISTRMLSIAAYLKKHTVTTFRETADGLDLKERQWRAQFAEIQRRAVADGSGRGFPATRLSVCLEGVVLGTTLAPGSAFPLGNRLGRVGATISTVALLG